MSKKNSTGQSKGSNKSVIPDVLPAESPASKKPVKLPVKLSELPEKHQIFAILKEQGVNIQDIGKMLGYTKGSAYVVNHKLKKLKITGDTSMMRQARRVLKETMKFKPLMTGVDVPCPACKADPETIAECSYCNGTGRAEKVIFPSVGNRLEAAKIVIDRSDPATKVNQNLNVNVDIDPVDMDSFR